MVRRGKIDSRFADGEGGCEEEGRQEGERGEFHLGFGW